MVLLGLSLFFIIIGITILLAVWWHVFKHLIDELDIDYTFSYSIKGHIISIMIIIATGISVIIVFGDILIKSIRIPGIF